MHDRNATIRDNRFAGLRLGVSQLRNPKGRNMTVKRPAEPRRSALKPISNVDIIKAVQQSADKCDDGLLQVVRVTPLDQPWNAPTVPSRWRVEGREFRRRANVVLKREWVVCRIVNSLRVQKVI